MLDHRCNLFYFLNHLISFTVCKCSVIALFGALCIILTHKTNHLLRTLCHTKEMVHTVIIFPVFCKCHKAFSTLRNEINYPKPLWPLRVLIPPDDPVQHRKFLFQGTGHIRGIYERFIVKQQLT